MRDYLNQHGVTPAASESVVLAIEEAMSNAVRHSQAREDLEVVLRFDGRDLFAAVKDQGMGFDVHSFDRTRRPDPLAAGGRGLYLIARLMDELELRSNGGVEVRMLKRDLLREEHASYPLETGVVEARGSEATDYRQSRQLGILEEIGEGFAALDWEYRFIYANKAALQLYGRAREEVLGQIIWEFFPHLQEMSVGRSIREAMELGQPAITEFRSRVVDLWLECRVYPTSSGISIYLRDITERRRKEEERDEFSRALGESQRRLALAIDSADIGTWDFDPASGELEWSNRCKALFGLPPDAHVDYETFLERVHAEDRQRVHEVVQGALDPDGSGEFESEYRASWPDGSQHWILATGKASFGEVDGERRPRRFIGVVIDISARKAAQHRLGLRGGRESRQSEAARFGVRLTEGFLGRAVSRFRGHKLQVLLVSCAIETGFLVAMGTASHSRQVFGLPGSLMALTVVVAGALAGPIVGVLAAVFGGAVFYVTVADMGSTSSPATTLTSLSVWVAAALLSSFLAEGLRLQSERRMQASLALAKATALREAQLAEQQRVEELAADLQGEREQLRTIIEQTESAVVLLDRDFNFLHVNSAYAETCGYLPEEMVGLNHFDLYPDAENEAIFRSVRDTGEAVEYIARPFAFPDQPERGTTYWDWRLAPVKDRDGEVEALVFSLIEVTERVRSVLLGEALAEIDEVIHSSLQSDQMFDAGVRRAATALGCTSGALSLREGANRWVVRYGYGFEDRVVGRETTDDQERHAVLAIESGRPIAVHDASSDERVNREQLESWGIRAVLAVPLIRQQGALGVLFFNYRLKHVFSEAELAFAARLGSALSLAIENARQVEELQRVATTLQENMIHPLPVVEGLDLGVVSQTAFRPELVGGDFYDVFQVHSGLVVAAIGDVMGKGIKAAGRTETMRSTVRALAAVDPSPAFVLRKTNELLLEESTEEELVTLCVLTIDVGTGHVSYASAGHPAPVHLGAFSCHLLSPQFGPPLASFPHEFVADHVLLTPDDYLVLYTDGVTEARAGDELFGEERLVRTVAELGGATPPQVAEAVREAATSFATSLRDDLQVLVLRLK